MDKKPETIKHISGLLVLALITCLFFLRTANVREKVALAARTKQFIKSDSEFFRTPILLGGDYRILDHLRSNYPEGTTITLQMDEKFSARIQRFWLALLPEFRISSKSSLEILPKAHIGFEEKVLVRGDQFVLVSRGL